MRTVRTTLSGLAAAAMAAAVLTPAAPGSAAEPDLVDTSDLRRAVRVSGIEEHLTALQAIADENGGTRSSGTPGYRASGLYVRDVLEDAGYSVKIQKFTFPFYRELEAPTLRQVSPTDTDYESLTLEYSPRGDVTGELVPANTIAIPPGDPGSTTSGCAPTDFAPASTTEPQVALIQRGFCDFAVKVQNAADAGYDAAVLFNEGQEGRTEAFAGTLGEPGEIPAVFASYADGVELYEATQEGPVSVQVVTRTQTDPERPTFNVIANSRKGAQAGEAIVVGAHLDSVPAGPGINDNGSGTAAILEIAQQMKELGIDRNLQRRVRFAFWGAEEWGLLGAQHYVDGLSEGARAKIAANLNFDMVGSPNFVRFVYDGNGDSEEGAPSGPAGSAEIEQVFTDYFANRSLPTSPTLFDGRSDYGPFIDAGIPAGGLFSGAEGIKTEEEAEIYGGTAGEAYDACYHLACDDVDNISRRALNQLSDAAAHSVGTLALSEADLVDGPRRVPAAPHRSGDHHAHGQAARR